MPDFGDVWSSTWGSQWDKVHRVKSIIIGSGLLRAEVDPSGVARGRNYALFVNGKFTRIMPIPMTGDMTISEPVDPGSQVSSVFLVEVGDWDSFDLDPAGIPDGWIKEQELLDSRRIRMSWDTACTIVGPIGDSQLSAISLSGLTRGHGLRDPSHPNTRRNLTYTITTLVGGSHLIRLWAGLTPMAEGSRLGDGVVTLSEVDHTGISGSVTLGYLHDVTSGASIQVRWNASYQVHYSPSPLAYPRTPEVTILDDGSTSYNYLTPLLLASTYHYNVLAVDDEGLASASPPVPPDSPKVVRNPPVAPTITGASGCHGGISLYWNQGESSCRYVVMSSNNNEPPNDGGHSYPPTFVRPTGATSAVIPPVLDWGFADLSAILSGLDSAISTCLSTILAAWGAGETGFNAIAAQQLILAQVALRAYGDDVGTNTQPFVEAVGMESAQLLAASMQYTGASWSTLMGPELSWLLAIMGQVVQGNPVRWRMPDGSLPPSLPGPSASCADLATPSPRPCRLHCIVRARRQLDDIEEHNDQDWEIELDQNGCVVQPRPNDAWVWSASTNGLTLALKCRVTSDNELVRAEYVDLFCVDAASAIDYSSPQSTAALGEIITGVGTAIPTFAASVAGYYRYAVLARAGSTRSSPNPARERVILLSDSASGTLESLEAMVVRSRD